MKAWRGSQLTNNSRRLQLLQNPRRIPIHHPLHILTIFDQHTLRVLDRIGREREHVECRERVDLVDGLCHAGEFEQVDGAHALDEFDGLA